MEKSHFEIMIKIPNSEKYKVLVIEDPDPKAIMTLPDLMNRVCFYSKYTEELDANFISMYNRERDEYDYFIERLYGYRVRSVENPYQSEQWVPYINDAKESWTDICQNNRIVSKYDNILFKFELNERASN